MSTFEETVKWGQNPQNQEKLKTSMEHGQLEREKRKKEENDFMNSKIIKLKVRFRGFEPMTLAFFKNPNAPERQNGWDYIEVTTNGDEEWEWLKGKKVSEVAKRFRLKKLKVKWHKPWISKEGKITSLIK